MKRLDRVRQKQEKRRVKKVHADDLPRQRRAERQDERDKKKAQETRATIKAESQWIRVRREAYRKGNV